ncbi:MAG: hypothetical protein LBD67_04945 [Candidatus Accumulibacter sp.]|nr:hypothetical protein [Accumulibacter sp.]
MLKNVILYSVLFFAIRGEHVKNLSALNLSKYRHHLSPFVLSLSKYERTLQIVGSLSNSYSSTGFSILTLRQAQDRQSG